MRCPTPDREPERTCVGCRSRRPQSELLRLAARDGQVVVDRRAPGRGAWLCADRTADCLRLAVRSRAVARALRLPVGAVPAHDLGTLVVSVRTGVPDLDVARRESGGSMPMKG